MSNIDYNTENMNTTQTKEKPKIDLESKAKYEWQLEQNIKAINSAKKRDRRLILVIPLCMIVLICHIVFGPREAHGFMAFVMLICAAALPVSVPAVGIIAFVDNIKIKKLSKQNDLLVIKMKQASGEELNYNETFILGKENQTYEEKLYDFRDSLKSEIVQASNGELDYNDILRSKHKK